MRLRTIALALALACGFSGTMEAAKHKATTKKVKVKPRKLHKQKIRKLKIKKTGH
jgi:hypothetical protein